MKFNWKSHQKSLFAKIISVFLTINSIVLIATTSLIYFGVKLLNAATKKEFHHLSLILKIILFFGILSVAVIVFNLKLANA